MRGAESFENLLLPQEVKKFSVFYGTQTFITEFITACHFSIP
jgi:hypothetical protein